MKGKITMYENNKEDDFTSIVSVVLRRKDIEMLKKISWLKEHPENVRPEGFRAF